MAGDKASESWHANQAPASPRLARFALKPKGRPLPAHVTCKCSCFQFVSHFCRRRRRRRCCHLNRHMDQQAADSDLNFDLEPEFTCCPPLAPSTLRQQAARRPPPAARLLALPSGRRSAREWPARPAGELRQL